MEQGREEERQQIRGFLEENFLFGQECTLKDSDSFLDGGILDSTGILQLISFLGETYRITVEDEEVTPDNLDSIDKIAAFLGRKRNGVASIGAGEAQC
jgi:acyl carrier protein